MLPKNSGFQIGDRSVSGMKGPCVLVEERARVGVEERPVVVERAVLDRDRDLVVGLVGRELVAFPGRGAGQHGGRAEAAVEHGLVAGRAATDDVEAGRAGVHVQPRHAQRVVVVPDRRGAVVVRVLEDGEAGTPGRAETGCRLAREEVVPCALGGVVGRDVRRRGQVPRLGVAVALVADADGAVHVGHDRHRAGVRRGRPGFGEVGRVSRPSVPPGGLAQCSVGSTGSRWGR